MTRNGIATNVWATTTAGGRERQRDAEPLVEVLADQTATPEREEQRDAADDRWQHHRQRAQRTHDAPAREVDAGEQPRERHAEHDRRAPSPHSEVTIDSRSAVRTVGRR